MEETFVCHGFTDVLAVSKGLWAEDHLQCRSRPKSRCTIYEQPEIGSCLKFEVRKGLQLTPTDSNSFAQKLRDKADSYHGGPTEAG
ncbi:hypothetical protein Peur_001248 [Populus x canadensis]